MLYEIKQYVSVINFLRKRDKYLFSSPLYIEYFDQGSIRIDHARKILELEVNAQDDNKKRTNDARSLSGGERSYSTVAFILSLWDCTGLPFYFLDEFDVFMVCIIYEK